MILGIGTDIIKISRLNSFENYKEENLTKVFSYKELEDCLNKSALDKKNKYNLESLATRFAAKEAFFKALSASLAKLNLTNKEFNFIFACQNIEINKNSWDVPELKVNWTSFEKKIENKLPKLNVDLSLSHEKDYALAFVVISFYESVRMDSTTLTTNGY